MWNQCFSTHCLVILLISVIDCCYSYRYVNPHACRYTPTTVSGTKAPTGRICKGQLILDEKFLEFDRDLWKHELTLGGGGVSFYINIVCVCMNKKFTHFFSLFVVYYLFIICK